jgi:ribosomal-protein-alanine N-acetyltransferase
MVTLREVEPRDAASLLELINVSEVARFISQPPSTAEEFQQFIDWSRNERRRGKFICFAVVPHGMETAVGLFHLRRLDLGFDTAEWGFVLGSAFWGTGLFLESAELVIDFAFDVIGMTRLEARVAVPNGRGHGALRKVGAVQEAVLRRAFTAQGQCFDQALWSIVDSDRLERTTVRRRMYVH